ncbi:MAG TPA: hypothetical protein VNS22_07820 [Geminicoccus sp.]|uniref:hypothetical protein n=1 Tax=Geminicoccus sp. TaxID=2024832 RepID=UPI002BE5D6C8|nr:hypothetical protein [Geminicoccus sp.]HWL68280.1 hypothetical protein [Geminicoccus sp.]
MSTCNSCRFWHKPETQCRRNAPLPVNSSQGKQTLWPVTAAQDWCGEYQPKTAGEPERVAQAG